MALIRSMRNDGRMRRTLAFALSLAGLPALGAADALFDPVTGYRVSQYRAPVPDDVPGARVLHESEEVARKAEQGALLIDVMGAAGYRITSSGDWIIAETHQTLPGSIWLPEVGRGQHASDIGDYLATSLQNCTRGDTTHEIVVFCKSDCWMSWNAAQHISDLGYTNINWFPGGADQWALSGLATSAAVALPVHDIACTTRASAGRAQ